MKEIMLFIWQLPQNLVGLLVVWLSKPSRMYTLDNGVKVYYSHLMKGGISLGDYVVVNDGHYRQTLEDSLKRNIVRHEAVGHVAQSRMLGWLYLVVIGLPSLIWAAVCQDHRKYYNFYTEKWADRLAGIER